MPKHNVALSIGVFSVIFIFPLLGCSNSRLEDNQAKELVENTYAFPLQVSVSDSVALSLSDANSLLKLLLDKGLVSLTEESPYWQRYEAAGKGVGLIENFSIWKRDAGPHLPAGTIKFMAFPYEKIVKSVSVLNDENGQRAEITYEVELRPLEPIHSYFCKYSRCNVSSGELKPTKVVAQKFQEGWKLL